MIIIYGLNARKRRINRHLTNLNVLLRCSHPGEKLAISRCAFTGCACLGKKWRATHPAPFAKFCSFFTRDGAGVGGQGKGGEGAAQAGRSLGPNRVREEPARNWPSDGPLLFRRAAARPAAAAAGSRRACSTASPVTHRPGVGSERRTERTLLDAPARPGFDAGSGILCSPGFALRYVPATSFFHCFKIFRSLLGVRTACELHS